MKRKRAKNGGKKKKRLFISSRSVCQMKKTVKKGCEIVICGIGSMVISEK